MGKRRKNQQGWPPRGAARGAKDGVALVELQAQRGGQELPADKRDAAVDAITNILHLVWLTGESAHDVLRTAIDHFTYEIGLSDDEAEAEGY